MDDEWWENIKNFIVVVFFVGCSSKENDFFWSGFYGTNFFVSPQTGLVGVIMSQNQPPPASPWPGSFGVFIAPAFAFLGA